MNMLNPIQEEIMKILCNSNIFNKMIAGPILLFISPNGKNSSTLYYYLENYYKWFGLIYAGVELHIYIDKSVDYKVKHFEIDQINEKISLLLFWIIVFRFYYCKPLSSLFPVAKTSG